MTVAVEVGDRDPEGLSEARVARTREKYARMRGILQEHGYAAGGGGSEIGNDQVRLAIAVQVSNRDIDRSGLGGVRDRWQEAAGMRRVLQQHRDPGRSRAVGTRAQVRHEDGRQSVAVYIGDP